MESRRSTATEPRSMVFEAMASRCEVQLAGVAEAAAAEAAEAAVAEVRRIEIKYSRYRPDSIVSRINAAAGKDWIECDDETAALLSYADSLYAESGGLFDITSGILRRVWNFQVPAVPSAGELLHICAKIGWRRVERRGQMVRLPEAGMEIDFGGFGKEYATDRAAGVLVERGLRHGLVNLGGDLRILGPRPDGQAWAIGIQDPRNAGRTIAAIPMKLGALATSGDYERYFELDGRRYCHILDPRSGYPVTHWRSISVMAPVAVAAGSHSTIAMLKQDEAIDYLDSIGVAYLAIDGQGRIYRKDVQS